MISRGLRLNTDGSFFFSISDSHPAISARISIGQGVKSLKLLEAIVNFLGFGNISKPHTSKTRGMLIEISITRIKDVNKLIEILKEYKLYGAKYLDFTRRRDFCKGIQIINSKTHLTFEGLYEFKALYDGMIHR